MTDFIVNKAGAKVYKDINKHKFLDMPTLKSEKENGKVYEVLSAGILGVQREALITVKEGGEVVAYRLPDELNGWVHNFLELKLQGLVLLPAKIEFGILGGRPYAEIY